MNLRRSVSVLLGVGLAVSQGIVFTNAATAATVVERELVDVNFTTATMSSSTITNNATDKTADLTVSGSPTGLGTADGLIFSNTTASATNQYITGNLGNTSLMSQIVVEFEGKFPDKGCTAGQPAGSMVFSLGSGSVYIPYNIYRHSNFIGFNTFNSDLYGINLPDITSYHSYKFVMVPGPAAQNLQEIWVDGVQQTLTQKSTSVADAPCGTLGRLEGENISARAFTGGSSSYVDGSFMLMSHPLAANTWGTSGSLKNIRISTTNTFVEADAPLIDAVTPGDGQLSIFFAPPSDDGGSTVTDYEYSTDNGVTWVSASSTSSPIVVTGLSNGTSYNVKLRAINAGGDGTASSAVAATPTDGSGGSGDSGGDSSNPSTRLADTGSDVVWTALGSLTALILGATMLVVSRRRQKV